MIANAKILIVDDEPAVIEPLIYTLESDGFSVESVGLGGLAIESCKHSNFDLVVLDVGLPDMSGFEVCKEIQKQNDIPVLFLSARVEEIDRLIGLEIGADDYVVKPFSPREVVARIKIILKRRVTVTDVATLNNLVIDIQKAKVCYFNQELELTKYEFLILSYLAQSPEQVFSRQQILEHVWPNASGSMERSVDTHIKTLRAKLKSVNSEFELIKTHRGLGYSLEPC